MIALILSIVALVISILALVAAGGAVTETRDNLRRIEGGPAAVTDLVCASPQPTTPGYLCDRVSGHVGDHGATVNGQDRTWPR